MLAIIRPRHWRRRREIRPHPFFQFQITNFLAPSNYNSDGYANLFNFQPVIPIPRTEKFPFSPGNADYCADDHRTRSKP